MVQTRKVKSCRSPNWQVYDTSIKHSCFRPGKLPGFFCAQELLGIPQLLIDVAIQRSVECYYSERVLFLFKKVVNCLTDFRLNEGPSNVLVENHRICVLFCILEIGKALNDVKHLMLFKFFFE